MPKRKKISLVSEDSKDGSEYSKQRKFLDSLEICHELYETIRNYKTDDGHVLCESFIRAPNRRSLADYYDIITAPIDLMKIQQKLKTEEYSDVNQFTADIELMINNAKTYYKKSSQEYKDACELWEIFMETKNELLAAEQRIKEEDKSSEIDDDHGSECSEEDSAYEELFTTVMTAADMEGRPLSTMFQLLPSRSTCDLAMTSEVLYLDQGQANGTYHFKILVPSVAAGAIIGKGGETIAWLQKEAGGRIKMSKAMDYYPGTKERVCLITGSAKSILRILEFIMLKVKEKPDSKAKVAIDFDHKQPVEREKQVKILVPNSTAGIIIGKSGCYIKEIKEESGAYIQISQKCKDHALAERCITVIGDIENNKIACHMILEKIMEDPQSGSCLNVSYADITGPVANSSPTGSPFANPSSIFNAALNDSDTSYFSNCSSNSPNSSVSENFFGFQTVANHSETVPFSDIGIGNSVIPSTSAVQFIETIKTMLNNNGYSEQAVSEISAAMTTLANYGMLGLDYVILNRVNGAPIVSDLGMEMPSFVAASCPMSSEGIANQNMYTSVSNPPEVESTCNYLVTSEPTEGEFNVLSPTGSLSNGMSGLSLESGLPSPTIYHSKENILVKNEASIYEPFYRSSSALASPNTTTLPVNNNSFGLGIGLSSSSNLRKAFNPSDQQIGIVAKIEIEVGENIIGAILGPGGKALVDIQRFSGANIQISKKGIFAPGTRNRIVTISGFSNTVNTAQYLIEQQIAVEEAKRAEQNVPDILH